MRLLSIFVLSFLLVQFAHGQPPERLKSIFPEGTVYHSNIPYAGDTLKKHLLDIYLPKGAKANTPLVIWVHGGGWMLNDKYADMGYMGNTIRTILEKGYALASIDYRHSTTAPFPSQIQDCNQAVEFLSNHASEYKLDKTRIALIGFSAGGHLASLLALSANENVPAFYHNGKKPSFKIRLVLDFYGPSDLLSIALFDPERTDDPLSKLLGANPLKRPDLAKIASPSTYISKNDPPFFIVHGEKDQDVPYQQSVLLQSYLNLTGIKNELTIVKGAPHYGPMFDVEEIRTELFDFLDKGMK